VGPVGAITVTEHTGAYHPQRVSVEARSLQTRFGLRHLRPHEPGSSGGTIVLYANPLTKTHTVYYTLYRKPDQLYPLHAGVLFPK